MIPKKIRDYLKLGLILFACTLTWLVVNVKVGEARVKQQTVPTMPPPTATLINTPHNTPTELIRPTDPHSQPSATIDPVEPIPVSQTEVIIATEIKMAETSTYIPQTPAAASATSLQATRKPNASTAIINLEKPTITISIPSTDDRDLPTPGGNNPWLFSIIGGGIVIIAMIALGLWVYHRHKQVNH